MAKGSATWTRVKFAEVVDVVTDYWNRNPTPPERFVAGEHINEAELRVRRWGMTNDELVPPTFNRRFRAGDVLFHSRNLRKLACPDFDGITGEKFFVLRSRDCSRLLPELLPFLLQTPAFNDYVNRRWAGSTNKFLNKAPLVQYEFALPPVEEQRRIALLLSQSQAVLDVLRDAIAAAGRLYASALSHFLVRDERGLGIAPSAWATVGWSIKRLEDVGDPGAPISYGIVQPGLSTPNGVPTATSNNLNVGFSSNIHLTASTIEAAYVRSRIRGGDVLVTVKGFGTGNIGRVPQHFSGNITRDVARIRLLRGQDASYLMHLWKCHAFERYWRAVSVGTTRPELSIGKLRDMEIPWPSDATRDMIVERLDALEGAVIAHEDRLRQALLTNHSLLGATLAPARARGAA